MYEESNIPKNLDMQLIDFQLQEINHLLFREIMHLKSNEALHLRIFIEQILKELPRIARDSIISHRYLDKKRSLLKFESNIQEMNNYLKMLENFGYAKTSHIRDKIEELDKTVKFYAG